ncbi:hypothetical protein [Streptomyces sp. NPDC006274]|uniref:hypothetical protein n=1 Tax=unclassified Streptomyces TaxID=2593676 RepID=UPI0033B030BD
MIRHPTGGPRSLLCTVTAGTDLRSTAREARTGQPIGGPRRSAREGRPPRRGEAAEPAVSRDGRTGYVTGGFTRDGYWNGVTVVDLASGDTHRLAAGERPLGVAVL